MYLGIDLGGTKIAAGIVDDAGVIKVQDRIPTRRDRPSEAIIADMISFSKRLMNAHKGDRILGIGIGVPGPVDVSNGFPINCVNLGWKNIPIEKILSESLGLPAFAGNDATLAGVAEMEAGVLIGVKTGVMLTLGTGVGGAVICEGKIQNGANNLAGEIGHMIVGQGFYNCSCGRNGCLETFASATALIKYTKKLLQDGEKSRLLMDYASGRIDRINGIMIFKAAEAGDLVANKAVDRVAHYLAIGITNIVAVIDPEKIVLGGGMSKAGEVLINRVRQQVDQIRFYKEFPIGEILYAKYGSESGIVGAAMLVKQRLLCNDSSVVKD